MRKFINVFQVNRTREPGAGGDSGCPYVVRDDLGNYKMVGIGFGGFGGTIGYAMRASDVQRAMGITFGLPAPTAVAGAVQEVRPRETVTLSGVASKSNIDGDATLTYQWAHLAEQDQLEPVGTVTITGGDQVTASFTAPTNPANLIFRLVVTDGNGAKAADTVTVNVVNRRPVAFAGFNQVVPITTALQTSTVTLDGSGSDPDVDDRSNLTYEWSQVEGTTVTLSCTTVLNPTFTAPSAATTLKFRLTATDLFGLVDTDEVTVKVHNYIGTSPWLDTGEYVGCGPTRRREQIRLVNGVLDYGSVADPEEERWSEWADTSDTRPATYTDWVDTDPL